MREELRKLVYQARKTIRSADCRPIAIYCSFGKESVVLLRLALDEYKDEMGRWKADGRDANSMPFAVTWSANDHVWPETREYAMLLQREWDFPLFVLSGPTPVQLYKDTGWPMVPFLDDPRVIGRKWSVCTDGGWYSRLRDEALEIFSKMRGFRTILSGVKAADSGKTDKLMQIPAEQRRGKNGELVVYPLEHWSRADVEDCIEALAIPKDALWEFKDQVASRNGILPDCWSDLFGVDPVRIRWLAEKHPGLFRKMPWGEWLQFINGSGYLEALEGRIAEMRETAAAVLAELARAEQVIKEKEEAVVANDPASS